MLPRLLLLTQLLIVSGVGQRLITTVAGSDFLFPRTPIAGAAAPLGMLSTVALHPSGDLLLADYENHLIHRVTRDGTLRVIAGTGIARSSGEGGPATAASIFLAETSGIAAAPDGTIYFSTSDNAIRRISPDGILTTFAGIRGGVGGDGGPAIAARLFGPSGLALDAAGSLYVADRSNHRIRRIAPSGIITTIAGTGTPGFSGDGGPATAATFNFPSAVAVDGGGNVYVADLSNQRVRRIAADGTVSTFAGNGQFGNYTDGTPAASAPIVNPQGVSIGDDGLVYISVAAGGLVVRVDSAGLVRILAGDFQKAIGFSGDGGQAVNAQLSRVSGAVYSGGTLFIADQNNQRLRAVDIGDRRIRTLAGNGQRGFAGDNGPGLSAILNDMWSLRTGPDGAVYVIDRTTSRIRALGRDGVLRTVAGNGASGSTGDGGPATAASLNGPEAIAVARDGSLYIAERLGRRVRRVAPNGIISTFAVLECLGIAVDADGNVYVSADNNTVTRISPNGTRTGFAGNGQRGFSGDGGPALTASISQVTKLAVDAAGSVYMLEGFTGRVRRVSPAGIITTIGGTGVPGEPVFDGPAISSPLGIGFVFDFDIDTSGNVYVASSLRILMITPQGTLRNFCCSGRFGNSGDGGPASNAENGGITGLAVDSLGNIFFADPNSRRIRAVLAAPPTLTASSAALAFSASSQAAPAPAQSLSLLSSIPFVPIAIETRYRSGAGWLQVSPASGVTPRVIALTADPANLDQGEYAADLIITASGTNPATVTVPVTFSVSPAQPPRLQLGRDFISFAFPRNGAARSQLLLATNTGSGTLPVTVSVSTKTGGPWLQAIPPRFDLTPRSPVSLTITADPSGLAPGTYVGSIALNDATIPVILSISERDQAIQLSQAGLSFTAVAGGGFPPPQSFAVLNTGRGAMPWTVATTNGSPWLRTTPSSGSTIAEAGAVPSVQVSVDQAGLAPGRYYEVVEVRASGAANTPQVVTVFLEVLPPGGNPGSVLQPSELTVAASPALGPPGAIEILIYNLTAAPVTFRSSTSGFPLATLPVDGTVRPSAPARVVVQPLLETTRPGLYTGQVTFQFSDGFVRNLAVTLVVSPAAPAGSPSSARTADGCAPTALVPSFSSIGQGAGSVSPGWPIAVTVDVKDDCGAPLDVGAVTLSFSNGDAPISMVPIRDGRWQGTWQTRSSSAAVVVKAEAQDRARSLSGVRESRADLAASREAPAVDPAGVVSVASPQPFVPLAPGSAFSIYGVGLTTGTIEAAPAATLPDRLGETQIIMAGARLPLYFTAPNQVNAIVPFTVAANTTHQILVRRGTSYSIPVPMTVAPAQPSVFLVPSISPTQALAIVARDGSLNSPASPARGGDTLVLYCTGLGMVDPAVMAGTPAPSSPLAVTRDPVRVRIGGVEAPVAFAGLTPGFVGLYQVNVALPPQAPTGDGVPLSVEAGGQISGPVTLVIR